jgi:hypothetical protein
MKRRTLGLFAAIAAASVSVMSCAAGIETRGEGGGGEGGDDTTTTSSGVPQCKTNCAALEAAPCFIGKCNLDTLKCEIVPDNGAPCEDGLYCTVGEVCEEGACGGGSENPCNDIPGDGCQGATCDEAQKTCVPQSLPDGTPCFLEDLCTVNATCKGGSCFGEAKDCFFAPVPSACHTSACDPATGECAPIPGNDGASCPNDGDLCMVNKFCQGGNCLGGSPKDCSSATNTCNTGVCDPATGACVGDPLPPGGTCPEATDACNIGICDVNGACAPTPTNDGMACNDSSSCTTNDVCSAGACAGIPNQNYTVYFSETFASNAAGWTLGQEWEIGSAQASNGTGSGYDDPADDHTASADNGIAGVVIGGYASTALHSMYYIESPPFDTSAAVSVHLDYWRHLNSDYTPYMNNVIEVYNGAQWVQIWESGNIGLSDSQWNFITYDITAQKNANMRIRFGHNVGSGGVYTISSWNIDDIVVASTPCPP